MDQERDHMLIILNAITPKALTLDFILSEGRLENDSIGHPYVCLRGKNLGDHDKREIVLLFVGFRVNQRYISFMAKLTIEVEVAALVL